MLIMVLLPKSMPAADKSVSESDTAGVLSTSIKAAEVDRRHVHDLHATLLHLFGLDHNRPTFHYAGRDFRLADIQNPSEQRCHRFC